MVARLRTVVAGRGSGDVLAGFDSCRKHNTEPLLDGTRAALIDILRSRSWAPARTSPLPHHGAADVLCDDRRGGPSVPRDAPHVARVIVNRVRPAVRRGARERLD